MFEKWLKWEKYHSLTFLSVTIILDVPKIKSGGLAMAKITKDTTIGEAIQIDAGIIPILMSAGMHCVGCPSSAGETIEEAAMVHGLDCEALMEDITDYLESVG